MNGVVEKGGQEDTLNKGWCTIDNDSWLEAQSEEVEDKVRQCPVKGGFSTIIV